MVKSDYRSGPTTQESDKSPAAVGRQLGLLLDRLQQLEPIAEGIRDIETIESGQRPVGVDHHARLLESLSQSGQIVDEQSRVRLSCQGESRLDTEMDANSPGLEPAATSSGQVIGLGNPGEAEDPLIEPDGRLFSPRRHGQLHVMDPDDSHRRQYPSISGKTSKTAPARSTVTEHMFVLGIDPGLSASGYGLVQGTHPPTPHLAGVIRTDASLPTAVRLAELHLGLAQVIDEARPDAIALEIMFTNRNLQTAISVGRASGVALLAAAQAGVSVYEYAPTAVKSAVTGDGSANKGQVQKMVARLLNLGEEAPMAADAADALAIALCHLRVAPLEAWR
jgi:crossover junction endodeoxyribonuclease RuvC